MFKVTVAPQITLASKLYLQFFCGYAAPTPFPNPPSRPFEAICPKFQSVEGTPPPELLSDPDSDALPQFVEAALGTNPFAVDDRIPGTSIDLSAKRFNLQVSEPVSGSKVQRQIQIGDGLNSWREAVEGIDFTWADLTGAGQTSWTHDGVTYRVAKNAHTLEEHANAFLRLSFTIEG